MSKRLGGIISCTDETSSWYLIGFPDDSNVGSTVIMSGRNPPLSTFTLIAMQGHRHFQHGHFLRIVGVGKRGAYQLVHGDLPRQHPLLELR